MEELSCGVLVKFLQEIDTDGRTLRDQKPVLLQIRSIIPMLREGDLFPYQGFFLRVSDLSHALYVSLPQEHDEMVLYEKLHLGQLIYVDKLEAAYPVPMLKGVRPLHGRKPCYGNPKDLLPMHNLEKFLGLSNRKEACTEEEDRDVVEKRPLEKSQSLNSSYEIQSNEANIHAKGKIFKNENNNDLAKKKTSEKHRSVSASRSRFNEGIVRSPPHYKALKTILESPRNKARRKINESNRGIQKDRIKSIDDSSDAETTISKVSRSSRSIKPQRRERQIPRKMDATDHSIVTLEVKPVSDNIEQPRSPIHLSRHGSFDGDTSFKIKRIVNIPTKLPKIQHKVTYKLKQTSEDTNDPEPTSKATNETHFTDTSIPGQYLPQHLVELGQDVLLQRDVALQAAVEALLEASASEELLKCLSKYSELLSTNESEHHPSIEKFFKLQNHMARASLIFQSLGKNVASSFLDTNQSNVGVPMEAVQLAMERKQSAISWIKASLASNFTSKIYWSKGKDIALELANQNETSTAANEIEELMRTLILQRCESNVGHENQPSWVKGNIMHVSTKLQDSLQEESTRWFLYYVEDYLDWVSSRIISSKFDNEVVEMMLKIKRINDWLDEKCKDISSLEDFEVQSCGAVRSKLFAILLKHAERTALNAMV